tara:strand:+ start:1341 stop:1781 length:441 start_codon:yes stop_codon:yes gene_type:complete
MFEPLLLEADILHFTWADYQNMSAKLSRINKLNVEDELATLPTVYSYYHGLMIRAKTLQDELSGHLEACESALRKNARDTGPKLTAAAAEDLVNCDKDIQDLKRLLIARKEIYLLLKSVCDAISYKKDMLIQLSSNQRQETKLYSS